MPIASERAVLPLQAGPWWTQLNSYQWNVFLLSAMGWMFDTMDQNMFTVSRAVTMRDLLGSGADDKAVVLAGAWATSIFIIGWATGGLIFGKIGDKFGRGRTMALTVLLYAICTGLSGLAHSWTMFAFARFVTGLGIGGEFAAGAAFVAEVMPQHARTKALAAFQALSGVGNILAAVLFGYIVSSWRHLYFVGAIPALLAVVIRLTLKESEEWVSAKEAAGGDEAARQRFGRISDLFAPRWRRNTLAGLGLAVSGIVGLWGIGFYASELIDTGFPTMKHATADELRTVVEIRSDSERAAAVALLPKPAQQSYAQMLSRSRWPGDPAGSTASTPLDGDRRARIRSMLDHHMEDTKTLKSRGFILQNLGSICSVLCFGWAAARFGRRPAFFVAFLLGWVSVLVTFATLHETWQVWYLYPILGFGTLAPFGGYALYFPEIFPTRLRTTGTGLCYNVARYLAATGPILLGKLSASLDGVFRMSSFRVAAMIVASCYLIGIVSLIWAPETRGMPLPEEDPL